jgi:hypothetical protein
MMEKFAQAGEGGGCKPTPFFTIFTIMKNLAWKYCGGKQFYINMGAEL